MIGRLDLARIRPEQKANLIYTQAQADLSSRLWRAALGEAKPGEGEGASVGDLATRSPLESLIAMFSTAEAASGPARPVQRPALAAEPPSAEEAVSDAVPPAPPTASRAGGLGRNQQYQGTLEAAASRTGIPAAAIAAIVDAEAAKGSDGSWKLFSRNPRSSAAGLGQFLSRTWISEAERPGTWLNQAAAARGWLTASGQVAKSFQSELLALRYDAEASINATADYARANLDRMRKTGIAIGADAEGAAQAAYLGHHLGLGDAVKFLKGGLDPSRARALLHAQIGTDNAERRIAQAGCAQTAHRTWLLGFIEKHVSPGRFQATT